jgi:hypothetical protein
MKERLRHVKRYHGAIREVLLREWDPIGVSDVPEAQDEYDGYVYKIYGMLARHETRDRLVDHLLDIETTTMGLIGDRRRTEAIVDQLIKLREEIDADT